MRFPTRLLLVITIALIYIVPPVPGMVVTNEEPINRAAGKPAYLGKFCYGTATPNDLAWRITFESKTDDDLVDQQTYLIGVKDTADSYYAWRQGRLSCANVTHPVDSSGGFAFQLNTPENRDHTVHPHNHDHPHFWRVYVLNCDHDIVGLGYKLTFKDHGSQFSHDQQGVVWLYTFFLVAFALLLGVWTCGCLELRRTMEYIHPIIKLFSAVLASQFISVFIYSLLYIIYMFNGRSLFVLITLARLSEMVSIVVFTLFLMCLAQGWTVTTSVLRHRFFMVSVFALYVFLYVILLMWNMFSTEYDNEEVQYFYSSVPGICLLCVRMATLVWFVGSLFFTLKGDMVEEKRRFFYTYGVFGLFWLFSLPAIVVFAWIMAPWNRGVLVEGVFQTVSLVWLGIFSYLLWPSRAERYFRISAAEYLYGAIANEEL